MEANTCIQNKGARQQWIPVGKLLEGDCSMKLNEFTGGNITLLVKNVEEKRTKTNKTYLVMTLTDGEKE